MYIDLTQTFTGSMPVYPGDSRSELKQTSDIATDGVTDHSLSTGMHVGTHMDAPLHMIPNGKKISDFPAEKFFGRGKLIDARGIEKVEANILDGVEVGDIVLVLTGFGQKFRDNDYYEKYPELSEDFAKRAVELKIKMVGMDTPSPDRPPFLSHKILLGEEILIIENLTNLEVLVGKNFDIIALPVKLETDAALTRVVAHVQ